MVKLNDNINELIDKSEKLNGIKAQALADLEEMLNVFPEQWEGYTEEYIKAIKVNIASRLKLINGLGVIHHLMEFSLIDTFIGLTEVIKIIYKLEALMQDDDRAMLKYRTDMNEGLN